LAKNEMYYVRITKKMRKIEKKRLTKKPMFDIIYKRLARGARANLENDTETRDARKDR